MWEYNYTDELYHHGISGQKWGVRRYQNKDGTRTQAGKKRYSKDTRSNDAKEADAIKKKKLSEMSNAEIEKLTKRQQLESNYKRLNPNAVKKGLAIAGATAAALGTVAAIYTNGDKVIKIGKSVARSVQYKQLKIPGV